LGQPRKLVVFSSRYPSGFDPDWVEPRVGISGLAQSKQKEASSGGHNLLGATAMTI